MGIMGQIAGLFFGSGRNVVVETAQVFRENAEGAAARAAVHQGAVSAQYAAEFAGPRVGFFDRFIDGLNRLPRPFMAFGVLGLMTMAMVDPVWFAQRMVGISLVPEPLWWLMGAIVSFYFGARYQAQGERFQRDIAQTMARVPQVVADIDALDALRPPVAPSTPSAPAAPDAEVPDAEVPDADMPDADMPVANPALADWQRSIADARGQSHG